MHHLCKKPFKFFLSHRYLLFWMTLLSSHLPFLIDHSHYFLNCKPLPSHQLLSCVNYHRKTLLCYYLQLLAFHDCKTVLLWLQYAPKNKLVYKIITFSWFRQSTVMLIAFLQVSNRLSNRMSHLYFFVSVWFDAPLKYVSLGVICQRRLFICPYSFNSFSTKFRN